jgi:hypothetical protein
MTTKSPGLSSRPSSWRTSTGTGWTSTSAPAETRYYLIVLLVLPVLLVLFVSLVSPVSLVSFVSLVSPVSLVLLIKAFFGLQSWSADKPSFNP